MTEKTPLLIDRFIAALKKAGIIVGDIDDKSKVEILKNGWAECDKCQGSHHTDQHPAIAVTMVVTERCRYCDRVHHTKFCPPNTSSSECVIDKMHEEEDEKLLHELNRYADDGGKHHE